MPDQADKLRELKATAAGVWRPAGIGLPMIAVTGSRGGVGATTVAVNLAAVLADRGMRVALVDAAECNASIARAADVQAAVRRGTSDVAAGSCHAATAVVTGPVGMVVLAQRGASSELSRPALQRLLAELDALSDTVDLMVVDTGSGLTATTQRLWLRARLAILVTTTSDAAVVDCYAAIKHCRRLALDTEIRVVANQCHDDSCGHSMHARLATACQQFMSYTVRALPSLPSCGADPEDQTPAALRVWEAPNTPFGRAALWLGQAVAEDVAGDRAKDGTDTLRHNTSLTPRRTREDSPCTC